MLGTTSYADRTSEERDHDRALAHQAQAVLHEADEMRRDLAVRARDWARPLPRQERIDRETAIQDKLNEVQWLLGQRYFNSRGERQRPASLGKLTLVTQ